MKNYDHLFYILRILFINISVDKCHDTLPCKIRVTTNRVTVRVHYENPKKLILLPSFFSYIKHINRVVAVTLKRHETDRSNDATRAQRAVLNLYLRNKNIHPIHDTL